MSHSVPLTLTHDERNFLFHTVRVVITQGLRQPGFDAERDAPVPPSGLMAGALSSQLGAFVTLHHNQGLRGCIGMMESPVALWRTVAAMAWAAAFNDPRFPPLTLQECPGLSCDISILGPMAPCPDRERIELGRHGLMLQRGNRRGVFLPQVPVEQGWSLPQTLEQLSLKAGLPPDAWKDSRSQIFWYESLLLRPEPTFTLCPETDA